MRIRLSESSPTASFFNSDISSKLLNGSAAGLLVVTFGIAGCGSGSLQMVSPTPVAPQIVTQPASISVPLGQSGSFTAVATGTGPLTYQWSEDGTAIPNSNSATFTTSPVAPVDSGAKFTVSITNSAGSANSIPATLTVGPRSPKAGDLRFQQVGAQSTINGYSGGGVYSNVDAGIAQGFGNSIGSPLSIGGVCGPASNPNPYNCAWFFLSFPLPNGVTGLSVNYQSTNAYSNLASDLATLSVPNTVITSLDLEPIFSTYAISSIYTSQSGGFDYALQTVLPANFPVAAAQVGAQSRVITAVSFDGSGQVNLISYGWKGDTTTTYDVNVMATTFDNIAATATTLAADGYIITAIGGNFTDGFILVGTRVTGDSLPRPLMIIPEHSQQQEQAMQQGYATIGYLISADATNNFWIAEK
jgi:hypothetical protein